ASPLTGMLLASIACTVGPPASAICAAGKPGVGSLAATLIAPLAVAGEPSMYGFGPLLPADATTMTPSLAALFDATAVGSSGPPYGDPRDMLIASMLWSTAHSIASTTTLVEPAQPNTRTA